MSYQARLKVDVWKPARDFNAKHHQIDVNEMSQNRISERCQNRINADKLEKNPQASSSKDKMASSKHLPQPPPPPQWVLDLTTAPASTPKSSSLPDPPGYTSTASSKRGTNTKTPQTTTTHKRPTPDEMDTLKLKKAWEIAIAPAKQLPMQGIGMWMSGNSLQVLSIFMVFSLFKNPLQQIMQVNKVFVPFEAEKTKQQMVMVKLAFILCNLLTVALGVYKVNAMGLLP